MSALASNMKCQKLHLSFVRLGSTAPWLRNKTSLPGFRSLCLLMASIRANAAPDPFACVMYRKP